MDTSNTVNTETRQDTLDIATLVDRARHEGVYFPHDPSDNGDVQIRLSRDASVQGHRIAADLRARRAEVNAFHAARRPKWPVLDDGIAPRISPDEPDATIFLIQLEGILFEDRVADFIEQEVAYVQERVTTIVERGIQARRATSSSSERQPLPMKPYEFRGGRVVRR